MTRADWINAGGFLSMFSLLLGMGVALLIPGMEPAAFAGLLPGGAYLLACWFHKWESNP